MTYFQSEIPIAAMPIAPLSASQLSVVREMLVNVPGVPTIELLAQICNQQSERLQNMVLFV